MPLLGGNRWVLRMKTLLLRLIDWALVPLSLGVYHVLWIVDFFRPVRIGMLNDKGRISIMISYIEPMLRRLERDGERKNAIIIVLNLGRTPNEQLARMYRREVHLLDDRRWIGRRFFRILYGRYARNSKLDAELRSGITTPYWNYWNSGHPVLSFTCEEEIRGRNILLSMGLAKDAQFMCFCTREASYYKKLHSDWTRWDWEDTFHRNSDIEDYILAAQYCMSQDVCTLRVGLAVDRPLPRRMKSGIIDYSTHFRSEFGDIFLGAKCKFVLSGVASFWWIASAFNRPVVWANMIPITYRPVRHTDLFICKKLWSIEKRCLVTFREMIDAGTRYDWKNNCISDGIEVIDNTPDEILAVTKEMNERLDGIWTASEEKEELQKRFQALYSPEHQSFGFKSRIGADFLRHNQALLN